VTSSVFYLLIGIVAGVGLTYFFVRRLAGPSRNPDQHLLNLQRVFDERLDKVATQIDRRLSENVNAINESKSFIAGRVSSNEKTVREVSAGLGKLEQATATLQRTNEEISSFQNMLKHPKVRGGFGEVLLNNLLGDILPQDRYQLQYSFPDSGDIADAVIMLQDGYIVAIDAKFPLANYQAFVQAEEKSQKANLRTVFNRDVKKHIKDIAAKYISPQQKTLDYAFMYIPIEAIYYETMVHDTSGQTLWEFCLSHKVIPVSPNSFLAYLQTVLIGLRGMKIEQQAKEILQHLGQVRQDFSQFAKDYAMIGTHLNNAKNRYDDSSRRLDKFTNRLDQIETTTQPQLDREQDEHSEN